MDVIILDSLTNRYFDWLCEKVNPSRPATDISWDRLLAQMFNTDFFWSIPNDDNRAFDGKVLRDQFAYEEGLQRYSEIIRDECSLLEMLIALAERCDVDIMAIQQPTERQAGHWFWIFLENCGVLEYDDRHYDATMVEVIFSQVMRRNYLYNGVGGFFPLQIASEDQREVELWYQMNEWLEEKYPIDEEF
jgi:hypothetical protein